MRKVENYVDAIIVVDQLYGYLNQCFFNPKLPEVVITIQPSKNSLGSFVASNEVWETPSGGMSEITISAEHIGDSILSVAEVLLHEMVHFYNFLNNIKDCSGNGYYHNARFRDSAVSHGLLVDKDSTYGWALTSPSKELIEVIRKSEFADINIKRNVFSKPFKSSSTRKYICPQCGTSVRATKKVNIACLTCKQKMNCEEEKEKSYA